MPEPDVRREKITEDCEFVILACDGIWEVKDNQAVIDYFHQNVYKGEFGKIPMFPDMGAHLFDFLNDHIMAKDSLTAEGKGLDNMSVIVVELKK